MLLLIVVIVLLILSIINGLATAIDWILKKMNADKYEMCGEAFVDPSMWNLYVSPSQRTKEGISGHELLKEIQEKNIPVLKLDSFTMIRSYEYQSPEVWEDLWMKYSTEYTNFFYIVFWGTIRVDKKGNKFVRYLVPTGAWSKRYLIYESGWLSLDTKFKVSYQAAMIQL